MIGLEYNNLTVTPKSLIDPDIPLMKTEGMSQLEMITIRVELKLRPIEFMALVDICGSRNVQLRGRKKTTAVEMDNDMGHILCGKYTHDPEYSILEDTPVIGLWEYDCVAYFRGRSILSLTMGPSIRPLFPERGVVDEEELVLRRLLPSLYKHIFNDWFVIDRIIPVTDIPVYDCGVADNSAITRYISNGVHTADCGNLSGDDISTIKQTNAEMYKVPQLTMVVRSNFIDFLDVFADHPSCVEILSYDPLCKLFGQAVGKFSDDDRMVTANLIKMTAQIMYVIRISFTEDALDALKSCNWYREDNAIFDEVQRLLYQLNIFE